MGLFSTCAREDQGFTAASRYLSAIVFVGAAIALRWYLPSLAPTPYLVFYPAVVAAASLGGFGPGLLATIGSALAVDLLFDETPGRIVISDPIVLIRIVTFSLGGAGVSVIAGVAHSTRLRELKRTGALEESDARFRLLADNTHAMIGIVQGQRFVYVNRFFAERSGYTVDELLQLQFPALVHPDFRPLLIERARARQAGEPVASHYEFMMLTRSGEPRWVDFSPSYILYKGKPSIIGTGFDITDRKNADAAVKRSEERFSALANATSEALYRMSPDWSEMRELYSHGFLANTPNPSRSWLQQYVPAEAQRYVTEAIDRALRDKRVFELEHSVWRSDGTRGWTFSRAVPLIDADGQITEWFGAASDITQRVEMQFELEASRLSAEKAKQAAEDANRAKDQFLAALSHELRTPLTPVVAAVSMLRDEHDPELRREAIDIIARNVEMEARLIDDLLDITRIVRGKIELVRRPVRLCDVISRAADVCGPDLEGRGIHFGIDIGDTAPFYINADHGRLQQAFWNLMKNAIKFTPRGGCIGVRCRRVDTHVVTDVVDSGEGIDPGLLPSIFNPFEQGGAHITRQFGGLGLGLTITKGLVEMHGGTIEAFSDGKGKGATFRVRLPVFPVGQSPDALTPPDMASTSPVGIHSCRVLLVEDHGDTARVMSLALSKMGHDVRSAGDVATALQLAADNGFDLLLSDLGLPDGSGIDLLRKLRTCGHNFPAIALSGYGQDQDIKQSLAAGFSQHLTKPIDPSRLREAIENLASPHAIPT